MFDPLGLKSRYAHLLEWQGGLWINYWTQTVPHPVEMQISKEIPVENDKAFLINGIISSEGVIGDQPSNSSIHSSSSQPPEVPVSRMRPQDIANQISQAGKFKLKEVNKKEKRHAVKSGKHFIVLPKGLGHVLGGMDKWEQVLIGGVEDEVSAHTGIFMPHQNLDYQGLLERVEARILGWCEHLKGFEERR